MSVDERELKDGVYFSITKLFCVQINGYVVDFSVEPNSILKFICLIMLMMLKATALQSAFIYNISSGIIIS